MILFIVQSVCKQCAYLQYNEDSIHLVPCAAEINHSLTRGTPSSDEDDSKQYMWHACTHNIGSSRSSNCEQK